MDSALQAAILRRAAMEALGMIPEEKMAISKDAAAHQAQEPNTAAEDTDGFGVTSLDAAMRMLPHIDVPAESVDATAPYRMAMNSGANSVPALTGRSMFASAWPQGLRATAQDAVFGRPNEAATEHSTVQPSRKPEVSSAGFPRMFSNNAGSGEPRMNEGSMFASATLQASFKGQPVTRSGRAFRHCSEEPTSGPASRPKLPRIDQGKKQKAPLDTALSMHRTMTGRVTKANPVARAAKEKAERHLAAQTVDSDNDLPQMTKVIRKVFSYEQLRTIRETGKGRSVDHLLSPERLARGDIIQIWTDGSASPLLAGAAFVYREPDGTWRGQQFKLYGVDDPFIAELAALREALQFALSLCAKRTNLKEVHLFTDCLAAMGWFQPKRTFSPSSLAAREIGLDLNTCARALEDKGIVLDVGWVKGHIGEEGNEKADKLAKSARRGLTINGIVKGPVPLVTII